MHDDAQRSRLAGGSRLRGATVRMLYIRRGLRPCPLAAETGVEGIFLSLLDEAALSLVPALQDFSQGDMTHVVIPWPPWDFAVKDSRHCYLAAGAVAYLLAIRDKEIHQDWPFTLV